MRAAERQAANSAHLLFKLASERRFDGEMPGVVWPRGKLVDQQAAIIGPKEIYTQHTNHVQLFQSCARQLDRFRWVVRFSLPTIIVTGLVMAGVYTVLPIEWWMTFPGILIPLKVLAIIALVVVFITCPLFRQCSPVQGICNVDDLADVGSDRETLVNAEPKTESEAAK